ncbi:hypothetical protein C2845_PM18G06790 [Panicum miliaceum]|uniref:Mixed lineage kinase domain-containing protein n=1 Tax=Panicum miliaceum TaxID=4540 RepID=A0A3L6PLC0_PANMI|nr:hypothetical protein C2845_PM18G06790 [Panicum miliaceum]
MEPVSSVVGTIIKLLQEIAKAERTARRKRTRCRDLARREEAVGNVLRASKAGARADAAPTRMSILSRLKEALDDALKLVESSSRSGGLVSRLLASGARAARFDDVDKRNGFGYLIMHLALLDHVFWVGYSRVDFVSGPRSDWIHIHLFSHDSSH